MMLRTESVLRGERRTYMDTSILNMLFMIAPDLMGEIELRTLVLERVAALAPIGRRALAQRLHPAQARCDLYPHRSQRCLA